MTKTTPPIAALTLLLGCALHGAPAQAQLSRTFVSAAAGSDGNNCDRPTPCRSFQAAHDKTNPDGEITVLDIGGFGAIKITKSISIVNDGVGEASILVSGGATGITVQGGATTNVNLRGLTVQGIGFGGGTGMVFVGGSALTITNCVFRNLGSDGIFFTPQAGATTRLAISDTLLADNGNTGIRVQPGTNVALQIAFDGIRAVNNRLDGVVLFNGPGPTNATIANSVSANNGGDGFLVASNGERDGVTALTLVGSVAANNQNVGVWAAGSSKAVVRMSQSAVAGNSISWAATLGVLQSLGDNYIAGNADGDPAPPTIAAK